MMSWKCAQSTVLATATGSSAFPLYSFLLIRFLSLRPVVLLCEFLVPQEFRVHAFCRHILGPLGLLDSVGVSLVCIVVRARVLLLWSGEAIMVVVVVMMMDEYEYVLLLLTTAKGVGRKKRETFDDGRSVKINQQFVMSLPLSLPLRFQIRHRRERERERARDRACLSYSTTDGRDE